jgi:fatty acid-binding protein DegV
MRRTIVVDAGCDLSDADRRALGIELWPIEIVHPHAVRSDVRDERELLQHFARGTDDLLEASTRPMELSRARAKLMEFATRHDELLYIAIMTTRSPAMAQAKQASDTLPISLKTERKVRSLPKFEFQTQDSHQLFAGYAWVAAYAAIEMRAQNWTLLETQTAIEKLSATMSGYLVPGELKTIRERAMRKGEKSVSFLGYALGTALDIKPVIACRNGLTNAVGRIRGWEHAVNEVVQSIMRLIERGELLYPMVTIAYGGNLRELFPIACLNQLEQVCRKHQVRLLRSMMSTTGVVNVGAGGFSIAVCARSTPYGDFSALK